MDRLWFHQIILFSEQSLFLSPNIPKPITSESPNYSSKNTSQISVISEQEVPSLVAFSVTTASQDETSSQESDDHDEESTTKDEERERPTRLNLVSRKTRYHSSSPLSAQKQQSRNPGNSRFSRLQKTMSCKSLGELELEEVKGFMDLGFIFKKEKLSKHMMSLIPGLQRIDAYKSTKDEEEEEDNDDDDDDEKKEIMRPYLSEAWLIKRPDSPLLNMRIPRVSTTEDMKKHLKNWARTVASSIQQES